MLNCGLAKKVQVPKEKWAEGRCECGACTVKQKRPGGLVTVNCHCPPCRELYKNCPETKGVHSVLVLDWTWNVKSEGPIEWTFAQGAKRGTCMTCHQPVVTYGFGSYTFASMIASPSGVAMNRGLKEGDKIQPELNMNWDFGLDADNKYSGLMDKADKNGERDDYGLPKWGGACGNFCKFQCLMCPRCWCCCVQGQKPCQNSCCC